MHRFSSFRELGVNLGLLGWGVGGQDEVHPLLTPDQPSSLVFFGPSLDRIAPRVPKDWIQVLWGWWSS